MEEWNVGNKSGDKPFNYSKNPLTHHSITTFFHYSNGGEVLHLRPIFYIGIEENF